MNLNATFEKYQSSINDVQSWTDSEYNRYFAEHFTRVRKLYDRLKSTNDPITDEELESVLTSLPLELISVSEKLGNMRIMQETIKREVKSREADLISVLKESVSETKAKEQASLEFADDRMLISVYDSLAERVAREVSFSKELIMSCKKIWDARRNSEQPMPSISSEDLPEYQESNKPSTYIK